MSELLLVALTVATATWTAIAKLTDWNVAYMMVMLHLAVICMGADSML